MRLNGKIDAPGIHPHDLPGGFVASYPIPQGDTGGLEPVLADLDPPKRLVKGNEAQSAIARVELAGQDGRFRRSGDPADHVSRASEPPRGTELRADAAKVEVGSHHGQVNGTSLHYRTCGMDEGRTAAGFKPIDLHRPLVEPHDHVRPIDSQPGDHPLRQTQARLSK
jgi:hypothetical protein